MSKFLNELQLLCDHTCTQDGTSGLIVICNGLLVIATRTNLYIIMCELACESSCENHMKISRLLSNMSKDHE